MELPFKKGVAEDIINKWNIMYKVGPDVLEVFWEPQVFLCLDFWADLDDKQEQRVSLKKFKQWSDMMTFSV